MSETTFYTSLSERRRVNELLKALRTPCNTYVSSTSSLMSVQFVEEFQSRLLATHCFLDTILMEDAFEIAFIESAKSAGFKVNRATPGQRFWDVEIDGSRISLKSSKAKSLKAEKLHISKLCEAAWIQDCRSSAMRQEKTFDLFREYSETVDSIIQFRYFRNDSKYQLVEFPVQNFNKILLLDRQHFTADGPTIKIPTNAEIPDYSLKIDRSDSKITIDNINIDVCEVLAEWQPRLKPEDS